MPDGLFVFLGFVFFVIPFVGFMARKEIRAWWDVATDPDYQPPGFLEMLGSK